MTSPHRFLSNDRNAALLAAISANSVLPAESTAFPLPRTRQGTARAVLSGGYIGQDDTLIDIEIVAANGSGLLSAPVFVGAGNGSLSELSATGVPAQTFTLLLADTGTVTKPAAVDFYGAKLQAKPTGTAGNGIALVVSTASLVATPTAYSFLESVSAGDSEFKGPEWDFGAYTLTADGELDPRTKRLRFGHDPQVYRQYKSFVDGQWSYQLDPPIVRDLPAETAVYALTGSYAVTVTKDATVETYTGIVTLFDLLNALKTRSNLIEAVGVVVEDRTPGGMAAEDLPLRTDAYALPATYTGNAQFPGLGPVAVDTDAPTEIVTLTCASVAVLGGELWRVKGSVSGNLPDCKTGVPYGGGDYGWTVPRVLPPETTAASGKISVKDIQFAHRDDNAPYVEFCINPLVAGARAKAKTVEVIYTKKPPVNDCDCKDAPVTSQLDEQCLGVKIDGVTTMALDPDYQSCLQALYSWANTFKTANTGLGSSRAYGERKELLLCDLIVDLFASALADGVYKVAGAKTAWNGALTAVQTDIASIAGQTGIGADGWPTGAKLWQPGVTVSPGDYVRSANESDTPVALKVIYTEDTFSQPNVIGGAAPLGVGAVWPGVPGRHHVGNFWCVTLVADSPDSQLVANDDEIKAFVERYASRMDYVRTLAGIVPKGEASTEGDGCWQPCDEEYEWRVNGAEYLPACSNQPYHSTIKMVDAKGNESIINTQEFGFVIRCACTERLLPGDKFTMVIEADAGPPKTYDVGDTIKIPVIAGQALELAGGQDGNDTQTWTVRGSAGAAWPSYVAPLGAEPLYDNNGLQFRIKPGGVPFALGDQFTLSIAGGTFRWRRDGGAWSGNLPITVDPTDLADGLTVTFKPGPAPAFVAGDSWGYHVQQPHAPKLARSPNRGGWRWSGTGGEWLATFPADTTMTTVSVWHTCQSGATFTVAGLDDANAVLWTKPLAYRKGLAVLVLEGIEAVAACRKFRLTVANAGGGSIKWLWCGVPWTPQWPIESVTLRETWQMSRGLQSARLLGRGGAGEMAWSMEGNWLNSQDWADLLAMLEYLKAEQDQPFVFVPDAETLHEARLVRIGTDEIDISDVDDFQNDRRLLSVRLPLSAVPL